MPPPVLERVHERVHKGDATIGGFLVRSQVRSPVNPPIIVFRACVCAEDIVQRGRGDAAANKGEFSSFHRGEMAEVYLLLRTAVLYPFSCSSFWFLTVGKACKEEDCKAGFAIRLERETLPGC